MAYSSIAILALLVHVIINFDFERADKKMYARKKFLKDMKEKL